MAQMDDLFHCCSHIKIDKQNRYYSFKNKTDKWSRSVGIPLDLMKHLGQEVVRNIKYIQ